MIVWPPEAPAAIIDVINARLDRHDPQGRAGVGESGCEGETGASRTEDYEINVEIECHNVDSNPAEYRRRTAFLSPMRGRAPSSTGSQPDQRHHRPHPALNSRHDESKPNETSPSGGVILHLGPRQATVSPSVPEHMHDSNEGEPVPGPPQPDPEDDRLGPVDFLAIEFPGGPLTGAGFEELLALADQGIVEILDMDFINKDVDGKSRKVDAWDFAALAAAEPS